MEKEKKSAINTAVDCISGIFIPIVNILSAAGIVKGVLALLVSTSTLSIKSDTYLVLNAMADSLFYFFPMILAITSSKKFGANTYTAAVIAGILLYPALNTVLESGTTVHFFGLAFRGVTYHSGVIPIILAVALLAFLERFFCKVIPEMIGGFLIPIICIFIVSCITLLIFGPFGAIAGDALAVGYKYIYGLSPAVAGFLLGAAIQPMVIFGFHWSFLLIAMNNISVYGHDTVLALIGPAVFAQAGAALAVMVKSRDKNLKSICASAALSAMFGITEPAVFGVNLPRKTPMAGACIGGGIGGALAGISGVRAVSFALPSLVSFPIFFGDGFLMYAVSCVAGLAASFGASLLMKSDMSALEINNS